MLLIIITPSNQNENKISELTKTTVVALIANYFVKNIFPESHSKNISLRHYSSCQEN